MIVSHLDSETRSGFMAVLSPRFTELTEVLRQTLSPMDFVFALKVGCLLFDRHAPEDVIIAGLFAPFRDRLNELLFARLTEDERLWAQMAAQALVDTSRISEATPMIKDVVLAVIEINLREKLNIHERIDDERTMLLDERLSIIRTMRRLKPCCVRGR